MCMSCLTTACVSCVNIRLICLKAHKLIITLIKDITYTQLESENDTNNIRTSCIQTRRIVIYLYLKDIVLIAF